MYFNDNAKAGFYYKMQFDALASSPLFWLVIFFLVFTMILPGAAIAWWIRVVRFPEFLKVKQNLPDDQR